MERKVAIIPSLAPQFGRELDRRNMKNVASYPTPANFVVEDFVAWVAWPVDPSQTDDGGEAVEALVMEEEAEDEEDSDDYD
ncbi:hypothetical protein LR48_Vigan86s002700 [Vigna angularis]|uniref:Uncharacterized protein n=1 Tax=Phaseolus angularis TaxID=3914 RepID=A0A0L9T3Z2_PHAAN|nr:hypothetical protein LR48_Vigan86s002700 [Vigna angularis]